MLARGRWAINRIGAREIGISLQHVKMAILKRNSNGFGEINEEEKTEDFILKPSIRYTVFNGREALRSLCTNSARCFKGNKQAKCNRYG